MRIYLFQRMSAQKNTPTNVSMFMSRPAQLGLGVWSDVQTDRCWRKRPCSCSAAWNYREKHGQGNLCRCLFVFTLWESKLSGNWSDVIRAMLRTRPAVKSCVRCWRRRRRGGGEGGARSQSHKLISSRVVVAARLKILTPLMLFYLKARAPKSQTTGACNLLVRRGFASC